MRALFVFALLVVAALALVAVATWPAWLLVNHFAAVPFHRVGNRIAMLGLAAGVWIAARRLGVASRSGLGLAARPTLLAGQALRGLGLGLLFMLPLMLLMGLLGLRSPNEALTVMSVLRQLAAGIGSGLVVALLEETFLRGAMYGAVSREAGALVAAVSTSLLYAATHFFARYAIAASAVTPLSGLDLLRGSLGEFAHPRLILDAFASLTAVGLLLAEVRRRTGTIAAGIGLHAGWVAVMLTDLRLTHLNAGTHYGWLLSRHDGMVGWLTLAWTLLAAVPLLRLYKGARGTARG